MSKRKRGIVGIDSMTLVWGVMRHGTDEDKSRADNLFAQLDQDDAQVILPCIALSEVLTCVKPDSHSDVIAQLNKRFLLVPFDAKCASLAARLFAECKPSRTSGKPGARKTLRSDTYIVASVKVHGARVFYSADKDCRAMAERAFVEARDLPAIPPHLYVQPTKGMKRPEEKS